MRYLGRKLGKSISEDFKFSDYAFETNNIDKEDFYSEKLPKSKRLQEQIEKYEEEYEQIYELSCDVFSSLFRYLPELLPENRIKYEYLLNYAAIKELMKDTQYKELRGITRHDDLASLMTTELLIEKAMEIIVEIKEEHSKILEEYKKAKKEAKDLLEKAREEGQLEDNLSLEEARKKLKESKDKLDELYSQQAKREIKKGMRDTLNDIKEMQDTISNWGLGHDETYQRMSYEEKASMLSNLRNNRKLKKIAQLAGKLKEIFLEGQKAKTKRTRSHIEDITMGDDIPRVLASEMMRIRHPSLKRQFIKKYAEKRLLQHEFGGRVRKGKGPIIAMVDSSGSMSGENEIYSKAVCMTLLEVAKRQRRNFEVIHFDSGIRWDKLKTNKFTKANPYNIKEVIDMVEYFGGGGTEFEPPLKRAKNDVDKEKEFSKADLIMITDGASVTSEEFLKEFNKWKKKKNVTVFSILMDLGYSTTTSLEEFSDRIEKLEDVTKEGADVARNLFRSLI